MLCDIMFLLSLMTINYFIPLTDVVLATAEII